MINSRSLDELLPPVKVRVQKFIDLCDKAGIDLLVTSTYRDAESQTALYAQGRTTAGRIVTNAKAGESWHNHRCAVDVVPLINGKPVWDTKNPVWETVGKLGEKAGLDWGWRWKTFPEMAHFQYTGGLTLAHLKGGAIIT